MRCLYTETNIRGIIPCSVVTPFDVYCYQQALSSVWRLLPRKTTLNNVRIAMLGACSCSLLPAPRLSSTPVLEYDNHLPRIIALFTLHLSPTTIVFTTSYQATGLAELCLYIGIYWQLNHKAATLELVACDFQFSVRCSFIALDNYRTLAQLLARIAVVSSDSSA